MNLFDQATSIDGSGAGSIPGSVGSVFAQGTDVFGQTIPNWAFIAAGAVLVAVIIVMLVVLAQKARRKKRPGNPGGGMNSASRRPQAAAPARPVPEKMAPAAPPVPAEPAPQPPVSAAAQPNTQERPAPAEPAPQPRKPFVAEAEPDPVPQRIPLAEPAPAQEEYTRCAFAADPKDTGVRTGNPKWDEGDETAVGIPVKFLITYQESTWEETHTLEDRITLGRLECDVNLDPSDKTVSRKHCELILQGGEVYARNLSGSVQGTVLNGRRISGGASEQPEGGARSERRSARYIGMEPLNSGDELTLGRHTVRVLF